MWAATLEVNMDEPCFNLSELNQLSPPPDQVLHRFQIVIVVRGDCLAEYREDLGLAASFTRPEFRIPGAVTVGKGRVEVLHTVAELREIAECLRDTVHMLPFEPTDLQAAYDRYWENLVKVVAHESTFGSLARLVR